MNLIVVPYFPKVIAWALSDPSNKVKVCPILSEEIRFHGDEGDWFDKNGWRSLCFISAEICRYASRFVCSEFSIEDEDIALAAIGSLENVIEAAAEIDPTDQVALAKAHEQIFSCSQAIMRLELSYPDEGAADWDYLFSEWSYGGYPSPNYPG